MAEPLDQWHCRSPLPQGNNLNGVTYGNGTFVAVGHGNTILTSPDGVNWTRRESDTTKEKDLLCVTYGNNTFVAAGDNGTILQSDSLGPCVTSPNGGENWQAGTAQNITWSCSGNSCNSSANISLYKNGLLQYVIAPNVNLSSGCYNWTIPAAQAAGSDYKIKITRNSDDSFYDLSDGCFTLAASDYHGTKGQDNLKHSKKHGHTN